jgi:hypothetical protein
VTYCDIDELLTPHDKILFFGDMHIGHGFHEVQERGFGFVKECSHDVEG